MASKPTINQMSAYLSYKDEYANHDVFDRLTRGRDTIVKTTRAERRLTDRPAYDRNVKDEGQNDENDVEGEEEGLNDEDDGEDSVENDGHGDREGMADEVYSEDVSGSGYKLGMHSQLSYSPTKVHRFEDNIVPEEDEDGDIE